MKKQIISCMALLMTLAASAQNAGIADHLGVSVGVGTTGVTLDVSTMITDYVGLRAGVDIFPKIKVNTELDLGLEDENSSFQEVKHNIDQINQAAGRTVIDLSYFPGGNLPEEMDVQGQLSNTTFHFLADVYPFRSSSFHATVGFYIGGKEFISVYNKEDGFLKPISDWNDVVNHPESLPASAQQFARDQSMIGAELGDYFIAPDAAGNAKATIEVSSFRPYLGIGFGRAVPKKRLACQFDLGAQFWGSPKVYAPTYDKATGQYMRQQLTDDHAGGDGGDIIKTISKISVYPSLTIRLVGRIF